MLRTKVMVVSHPEGMTTTTLFVIADASCLGRCTASAVVCSVASGLIVGTAFLLIQSSGRRTLPFRLWLRDSLSS